MCPYMCQPFLPPANEVCEGFVFTGVCLSPQADIHTPPRQTPPGQTPPPPSTCWDMVNKWAVRIPLECIIVLTICGLFDNFITTRQRSCGKVMLSVVYVCHSVYLLTGGGSLCMCVVRQLYCRSPTKLPTGNIFSQVCVSFCLSVNKGRGWVSVCG